MNSIMKSFYYFLPYLRTGLIASIQGKPPEGSRSATIDVTLKLKANRIAGGVQTNNINKKIGLYGPAEIRGFDSRMVIATEPKHHISDFEPNYFPAIQFREPDFPWRYTAAGLDENGNLLPWMSLIVLIAEDRGAVKREFTEMDKAASAENMENKLLPYIENVNTRNLPDLSESWRWAHTQIITAEKLYEHSGSDTEEQSDEPAGIDTAGIITEIMREYPEQISSRIMCARRLRPGTLYNAFLVPTFKLGLLAAGLEVPPDTDATSLTWDNATEELLHLPYYYRWEFRTGERGDFEHLVTQLVPRELNDIGTRDLDCSNPGLGVRGPDRVDVDDADKQILKLEGALQSINPTVDEWGFDREPPSDTPENFQKDLAEHLNQIANNTRESHNLLDYKPKVMPPIYGRWHMARDQVKSEPDEKGVEPDWLDELNLDPRHRVVAGVGAEVIRKQQESLMASAWEQVGKVDEANALLNQTQLAMEISKSVQGRLNDLSEEDYYVHMSKALGRIREEGAKKSVGTIIGDSRIPKCAFGNALRRIRRPHGPIRKRQMMAMDERDVLKDRELIGRFNGEVDTTSESLFRAAKASVRPAGTVDFMSVTRSMEASDIDFSEALSPEQVKGRINKMVARRLALMIDSDLKTSVEEEGPAFRVELDQIRERISTKLSPEILLAKRLRSRIKIGNGEQQPPPESTAETDNGEQQPLPDRIMAAPEFDHPMYEPLKEQSMEWLVPGLETIPQNTISLLKTNRRFIEAYMMGCNHEFASELLWREYPTDQRGTYFRKFWQSITSPQTIREIDEELSKTTDYSSLDTFSKKQREIDKVIKEREETVGHEDITPIHTWHDSRIGGNGRDAELDEERLVLVIRGDLIRKYPDSVIFMVKGEKLINDQGQEIVKPGLEEYLRETGIESTDPLYPVFTSEIATDIILLGFNITVNDIKENEWFFVIQESPSETRFGLDAPNSESLASCDDIAWDHFDFDGDEARDTYDKQVDKYLNGLEPVIGLEPGDEFTEWSANAASLASCAMQMPVRIVVSSNKLIPIEMLEKLNG